MASPSPTSSPKGRRLHELLEEQQEPFFLDIFLLENGYSTRFLDEAPVVCWPGTTETRMLCKFTSAQFKKKRIQGFFRDKLLAKLPQSKSAKGGDKEFESSVRFCENKMNKIMSIKNFSPTSVFDLGSYRSSPVSHSEEEKPRESVIVEPKILDIFKQFLETAYTPEFEKGLKPLDDQNQPKIRTHQCSSSVYRENQERNLSSEELLKIRTHKCSSVYRENQERNLRSEEKKKGIQKRQEQPDLYHELSQKLELGKLLSKKICEEIAETPGWNDFGTQIGGIAMQIGDAILEDIILDLYVI